MKKSKKYYIAMRLVEEPIAIGGPFITKLVLPFRCAGLIYVFETKSHARKYYGRNVELVEIRKSDVEAHR